MDNNIEELNKLEEQIRQTQQLLENTDDNSSKVSSLKLQRNIFAILAFLLLAAFVFAYFYKDKSITDNIMDDKNISLIDKDSLFLYKEGYFKQLNQINTPKESIEKTSSLLDEKIIYSVQIGAFKEFSLTSNALMNLSEFTESGFNKFSLGNYKTYAEAKVLKDSLIRLGFKDCFLSAKSYGQQINIREALALSNEPEFLEQ